MAARKAEQLGHKNIKVFHAGIPAWKKAGNLMVSNIDGLERLNKLEASYILIDLRGKSKAEKGHIPKAVTLPKGGIDALKGQLPKYKAASIVLYNQDGDLKSAQQVYKKLTGMGYTQVTVLSGGLTAWDKAGKTVAKGPAEEKIQYVRKLLPGEYDVEAFKLLVKEPKADVMILDVRNASEHAEGALPGAKNIPLDELEQRLGELPKDKEIIVHCSTGVRAEMAYEALKKAGAQSKYVKAKVESDKEKKAATIEE